MLGLIYVFFLCIILVYVVYHVVFVFMRLGTNELILFVQLVLLLLLLVRVFLYLYYGNLWLVVMLCLGFEVRRQLVEI